MKTHFLIILGLSLLVSCKAHKESQSYNYTQALEAFNAEDYDKAREFLDRDLVDFPRAGRSYLYRAMIYGYNEQYSLALSDISAAIQYLPTRSRKVLSAAYAVRADIYERVGDTTKALADFGSAIRLNPGDTKAMIERAEIFYQQKVFAKAERDYRKALEADAGDVRALTGLGRNYTAQARYEDAEEILTKVTRLATDYGGGFFYRGLLYSKQGKADEAISDFFSSMVADVYDSNNRNAFLDHAAANYPLALSKINGQISLQPENGIWYFIRALLNERKSNLSAAISDYTKMLEIMDIRFKYWTLTSRANCWRKAGRYEMAISDFDESIRLDSTVAANFGFRADVKRLMGNYQAAIDDFTRAISIDPREDWFFSSRGRTREFAGDFRGALADYNDAIALNKDYANTYLYRGRLFEVYLNEPAKAREDYQKVLSLDSIVQEQGNSRLYALFYLGKTDEAIVWMNRVLEKFPTAGNYYEGTCLYSLMNRPADALACLKSAFGRGYSNFKQMEVDDDLINIRSLQEYIKLVGEWKTIHEESVTKDAGSPTETASRESKTVTVPMKLKDSGVYEISCKINELPLNLILDTGASDVSISQTEVQFMLKNGYLNRDDIGGSARYIDANGGISTGTRITLRKVDFNGLVLTNIDASVVGNRNAPILFGQSALSRYGRIIIDNEKKTITITGNR